MELNRIYNEDCLEGMKRIPDKSVDMILCDLPYGTTANKWDKHIDSTMLWEQYERIIKDDGNIVLTASQPFTTKLINSNIELFKYTWVWEKDYPTGFAQANHRPMKRHEEIVVFSKAATSAGNNNVKAKYNPQDLVLVNKIKRNGSNRGKVIHEGKIGKDGGFNSTKEYTQKFTNYPQSIIRFGRDKNTIHPTQKPVALFEYLIKTYSNEGETILDNCMGSGTTAIACMNTDRNYIGFELDQTYYEKSLERIKNHTTQVSLIDVSEGEQMDKHNITDEILAEALIGTTIDYTKDRWSSDWNGDEVGFDDVNVVGLYSVLDSTISYYVDTETGYVLDAWVDEY